MGAQLQSRSSGRRNFRPMSEINVTPFVDVMLVLLVVFMITAPLLTAGVKVDLPETKADQIAEENNKPLEITIDKEGQIYMGETLVMGGRIAEFLGTLTEVNTDTRIFIRADQTLDYGRVMAVLGELNKAGFRKVALLSVPAN